MSYLKATKGSEETQEIQMPEGCGWETNRGHEDEDERIRWEALRCHFGKKEKEKQET